MGQSTSQGTYEVDGDLAGVNEKSSGSNSSDDEEWSPALTGGKLLTPIFDFLMSIGDAIMGILQKQIMGTSAVIHTKAQVLHICHLHTLSNTLPQDPPLIGFLHKSL